VEFDSAAIGKRVKMKLIYFAAIVALGFSSAFDAGAAKDSDRKPNIIYVMLDDAGYGDFSAFGSPYVKTPTFDR